jgi:kumamolisin
MAKMVVIRGSRKQPLPNAQPIGPAPKDERVEITVRLRPRTPLPKAADLLKPSTAPRQILSHEEFEKRHGADPKDIAQVRKFARANGLSVVRESPSRRSVMLAGTVEKLNKAFDVNLKTYSHPDGTYRGRTGPVRIPASLAKIVEGVFGLDNRPVARRLGPGGRGAAPPADGAHPFNPNDVASLYNFPDGVDGSGQTIGIIELGGGYRPEDMQNYFTKLGLPVPTITPVSVDGAVNSPSSANSDDGEVVLDIQVASAVAPGAKIVVYFSTNDRASDGFLDAITKAVHDTENNPSVISISWGGPEDPSTTGFQQQFDQVLQAAAMLGITVCIAAGDDGAADVGPQEWDGKAHCDFPASSPFALACGGTRLLATNGAITGESIWNQHQADLSRDTFGSGGGGVSGTFPLPAYQNNAGVPPSLNPAGFNGRGVPDVTGAGDPDSGYNILVDGQGFPIGGTSAVAPLWAGLIARINQKLSGRVGFINPQIYALPPNSGAFNDITDGDNRCTFQNFNNVGYDAGQGWDPCSGLGSPNGVKLSGLLTPMTPAPSQAPVAARTAGGRKAKAPAKKRKRAK